ncbi:DHA2 family efflux MFS transporter permease subunit [Kitasatospora sp. NPDC092286]|uniref:DHA2 family efflux MFS transporter permease subunit n=1 Tax=Kitasatospora sp. NPDC092286 TaxID=3364087 RepID=UPI00380183BD
MSQPTAASDERPVRYRWWALAVIGLAQLMVVLDTTIVNIAMPWAQQATGMSDTDRQWVVTAYTLAFGGLLLTGGRIGDLLGRRRAFVFAVVGFTIASAVGGAAPNAAVLVGSRVAQGVFAAVLMPATLAMLATTFTEPRERAKAFGVFSSVASAGGALGLLAGGMITQWLDWRWCLYVNVPIGVLVVIGARMLLPNVPAQRGVRVDLIGALLSAGGMVALVYGFGQAADDGWSSGRVIGLLVAAAVLIPAFAYSQARVKDPLLPLRVLADRNRVGSFLTIALTMIGMYGLFLILTYQLQGVMHYSPLKAGLAILPAPVSTVLVATQATTRLMLRVPVRVLVVPGLVLASLGLFNLGRLTLDSSYAGVMLPTQIVLGVGLGLVMAPCVNVATSSVQLKDMGVVSAFVSTSQQVGGSIGTALLNTIATTVTASALVGADGAAAVTEATVHGYAVASRWAGGIVLAAAVAAALLFNTSLRKPPAPAERTPARTPGADAAAKI